jgi:hypothetical protein
VLPVILFASSGTKSECLFFPCCSAFLVPPCLVSVFGCSLEQEPENTIIFPAPGERAWLRQTGSDIYIVELENLSPCLDKGYPLLICYAREVTRGWPSKCSANNRGKNASWRCLKTPRIIKMRLSQELHQNARTKRTKYKAGIRRIA